MSSADKPFYVTTPIYYPNAEPHFGHAYTSIACDVLARFNRLDARKVFFLTGTDEHGLKIKQSAAKEGITPQQLVDRVSARFATVLTAFNISNDDFIRTSEPRHHRSVQELWRRMVASGDLYLDSYGGWYSVRQEAFFKESETTVGEDGIRREPLGSPVEWARLINALGVLGQADRARGIWAEARQVFADQPDALAQIEAAARQQGFTD